MPKNCSLSFYNIHNYQTSFDTSLLSSGTQAGWASTKPFNLSGAGNNNFSYRDNGFIMGSGINDSGQLGNTTRVNVGEPFALYKEGDSSQPFVDAIDYSISGYQSGLIDSTGKLYTTGMGSYGALGNGTTSFIGPYGSASSNHQWSFQQVVTQSSDLVAEADKVNALPDNYQAVSVVMGEYNSAVLLNDGTLYGAGQQYAIGLATTNTAQTHYTRLDGRVEGLPEATPDNKIKDFTNTYSANSAWVLYENGELYKSYGTSYVLVASDIKFFDADDRSNGRVYAVTAGNQILSCSRTSTTLTTLVAEPQGTVTQVRASSTGGWGYLNSNNELYLSTTLDSDGNPVVPGAVNNTPLEATNFYKMDNVAFFDIGGGSSSMTYGVMYVGGAMTVWGSNSVGQLGNGSVGNTEDSATTPEAGAKPDIEVAPEDIPNVGEDDGGFNTTIPFYNIPLAIFLIKM